MGKLMAKLYLARAVKIDADRRRFFLESVLSQGMTREQAVVAWNWIVYGDWTLKGSNPTVELADFYPTERQVQETAARLKGKDYRILTARELERELKVHYNAGYADGYAEASRLIRERGEVARALQGHIDAGVGT